MRVRVPPSAIPRPPGGHPGWGRASCPPAGGTPASSLDRAPRANPPRNAACSPPRTLGPPTIHRTRFAAHAVVLCAPKVRGTSSCSIGFRSGARSRPCRAAVSSLPAAASPTKCSRRSDSRSESSTCGCSQPLASLKRLSVGRASVPANRDAVRDDCPNRLPDNSERRPADSASPQPGAPA